jgi:hypothetical protein
MAVPFDCYGGKLDEWGHLLNAPKRAIRDALDWGRRDRDPAACDADSRSGFKGLIGLAITMVWCASAAAGLGTNRQSC